MRFTDDDAARFFGKDAISRENCLLKDNDNLGPIAICFVCSGVMGLLGNSIGEFNGFSFFLYTISFITFVLGLAGIVYQIFRGDYCLKRDFPIKVIDRLSNGYSVQSPTGEKICFSKKDCKLAESSLQGQCKAYIKAGPISLLTLLVDPGDDLISDHEDGGGEE